MVVHCDPLSLKLLTVSESLNKWHFWKVWHLNFLKPYRLSSDAILIRFYKLLNFVDFPFLKMRFYDFIVKTWVQGTILGTIVIFFRKYHQKSLSEKKTWTLSHNIYLSALEFVFFTNFTNIDVCHIFICRSIREYSMTMKIFSSKSMICRLSNALSNASIAFLVPEKFAFTLVKLTQ